MFVLSMKHNRKRTAVVLSVLLLAVAGVAAVMGLRSSSYRAQSAGKKYSLNASTNGERVAFFKQFGWEVKSEPVSVADVAIPAKFDDVYTAYNNIQKEQGLDLVPYAGRTVKQWIYQVTNYPQQESMRGTVLVCGGRVVGGDLSTPELDGFMTGFDGQIENQDFAENQPTLARGKTGSLTSAALPKGMSSAEEAKRTVSSAVPANAWPTD